AREFLSGVLVGAEIKAVKDIILGGDARNREVVFIGDPGMTERYMRAFALADGRSRAIDGGAAALAGLLAVRRAGSEAR
ncbi:MAG: 2-dehydro-3-deoxygalactonokinase, partial [Erythrobacter sp.]|nr:2-dehydro-3-deoxygalactonokinase [Erythrobacter sp.]